MDSKSGHFSKLGEKSIKISSLSNIGCKNNVFDFKIMVMFKNNKGVSMTGSVLKFRGIKGRQVFQAFFGFAIIALFMFFANAVFAENILACMGATMFIVMTMPHSYGAKPRYLLGGYCCGSISGLIAFFIAGYFTMIPAPVIAGLAVGLAIFLTVCLNFEHPPSGALALGVAFSNNPFVSIIMMLCCIAFLCIILRPFKKRMTNLLV
jgi:hypothetical protein